MYTILDYAYNGLLYLNNMARPRHKRLSQLMIYSTTACQSLPSFSKINKVELMDTPFEKTPKMSIKRFLYK